MDCENENQVFQKFNAVFEFYPNDDYSNGGFTWDILDDVLWGYIQGPEEFDPSIKDKELEAIHIKVINSEHLRGVYPDMKFHPDRDLYHAIVECFNHLSTE